MRASRHHTSRRWTTWFHFHSHRPQRGPKLAERANLLEWVDRTDAPDHTPPATLDQILRHAEARRHSKRPRHGGLTQ
jgi:hypothetical protein